MITKVCSAGKAPQPRFTSMEQHNLYLEWEAFAVEDVYVYRANIPENVSYADGITVNGIWLETNG